MNMVISRQQGAEVQESNNPIKQLFDTDLEGLTSDDHACIRAVASSAPVPVHSLTLSFSDQIISGLIERRLLISSGGQLSLYSDIFRDYVLYGRLPDIPNTYCPYLSAQKLVQAVTLLAAKQTVSYSELANHLGVALTSTDNMARDLSQMGIVRLNRIAGIIESLFSTSQEATQKIIDFLRRHIILSTIDDEPYGEIGADFNDIVECAVVSFRFSALSRSTIQQYCAQIIRLAAYVGLIQKRGGKFIWSRPIRDIASERLKPVRVMSRTDGFMGQAPPRRVVELMNEIRDGISSKDSLCALGLRNAIFAATSLGLVRVENGIVRIQRGAFSEAEVKEVAGEQEFVTFVRNWIAENPAASGPEIGAGLAEAYGFDLHHTSLGRYGSALRQWAE